MHLVSALHHLHHQVSIVAKRAAIATAVRKPFCTASITSSSSTSSSSMPTSCSTKKNENVYMVQFTNDGEFMKVTMPEPDKGNVDKKRPKQQQTNVSWGK